MVCAVVAVASSSRVFLGQKRAVVLRSLAWARRKAPRPLVCRSEASCLARRRERRGLPWPTRPLGGLGSPPAGREPRTSSRPPRRTRAGSSGSRYPRGASQNLVGEQTGGLPSAELEVVGPADQLEVGWRRREVEPRTLLESHRPAESVTKRRVEERMESEGSPIPPGNDPRHSLPALGLARPPRRSTTSMTKRSRGRCGPSLGPTAAETMENDALLASGSPVQMVPPARRTERCAATTLQTAAYRTRSTA